MRKGIKFSEKYCKHTVILNNLNKNGRIHIICKICNKEFKSVAGFTTHILRKHAIDMDDYILSYFKNLNSEFKYEKCSFCEKNAVPTINVDFINSFFYLTYPEGYNCFTEECIDNVCLDFFGKHYKDCPEYEHIGSKMSYLSKLYRKDSKDLKSLKWAPVKNKLSRSVSLEGYIYRNGEELGRKKYQERCNKISKSVKIDWYIEKYGIEEGIKKFEERQHKSLMATGNITHSKNQFKIFNALYLKDNNWKAERYAGGIAMVDMLNLDKKIAIEYFGDYWHCNPEIYPPSFFNKNLNCRASEKQAKDKERIAKILNDKRISLIIIIWEKTFINLGLDAIMVKLQDIFNKYDITKKETIWI